MRNYIIIIFATLVFFACTKEGGDTAAAAGTGKGGSLARFTIAGNHLYLADYSTIEVYDISDAQNPVKKSSVQVNFGIETIFPFKDKLFIGSTDGMFIYELTNPDQPKLLGTARHVRSCDPVVSNETTAFVTLRGGSPCGPAEDGLYIYNIQNITQPVQTALLKLSTPNGLGLRDSVVFVCRGNNGMTAVNVKNPAQPKEMYTITGDKFVDVIPIDDILICYTGSGLALYDLTNLNQLKKLGSFEY